MVIESFGMYVRHVLLLNLVVKMTERVTFDGLLGTVFDVRNNV